MRRLFALFVAVLLFGGSLSVVAAQDDAPANPEVGDDVTFVDADGNEAAVLIVEDVVDPFEDSADDAPRRSHFVLVTLSVENTGEEVLEVDPAAVFLQDEDGFLYAAEEAMDLGDEEPLDATELDAGDDLTGAIGYAVPDSAADLARVFYRPTEDRLLLLADLRSGGGAEPTEEPIDEPTEEPIDEPTEEPAEPTAEVDDACVDIILWIAETSDRIVRNNAIFDDIFAAIEAQDPDAIQIIRDGAAEIEDLANEQANTDVPEGAEEANDLVVQALNTYAEGLNTLADAFEAGSQAGLDDAQALLGEGDDLMNQGREAIGTLAEECGG